MKPEKAGAKALNTRAQILQAAERLFLSKGYEAVTIDEICAEEQLTKGAFYYHFRSKEEILSLMFIPRLDRYLEEHYRLPEEAGAGERLLTLARCSFACAVTVGREVVARSAAGMLAGLHAVLYREDRIHTRILADSYARAREEGILPGEVDFRSFCLIYSTVMTGALMNWASESPQSDADIDWDAILTLAVTRVFPPKNPA